MNSPPSVGPSVTHFRIGSLVFSDSLHEVRGTWSKVTEPYYSRNSSFSVFGNKCQRWTSCLSVTHFLELAYQMCVCVCVFKSDRARNFSFCSFCQKWPKMARKWILLIVIQICIISFCWYFAWDQGWMKAQNDPVVCFGKILVLQGFFLYRETYL